jgi:hypothetical protein
MLHPTRSGNPNQEPTKGRRRIVEDIVIIKKSIAMIWGVGSCTSASHFAVKAAHTGFQCKAAIQQQCGMQRQQANINSIIRICSLRQLPATKLQVVLVSWKCCL